MEKIERLVNLVAMLLDAARPLPLEKIREALYRAQSEEAFKRMFDRDKEELRELGIPVERVATDAWEAEEGYRIPREEATLPDLGLEPDEMTALMLAAGGWEGEIGAAGPRMALLKLSAASRQAADEASWMLPRVDAGIPALPVLVDAIVRRKRVRFSYRTGGGGAPQDREVDPYALRYRASWYLTGFDHLRGEMRLYKLDRIDGVPRTVAPGRAPDFDPPASVASELPAGPIEAGAELKATVAFAPDVAWSVERRTGIRPVGERADGWVVTDIGVADRDRFVDWVLGFADDAVVIEPPEIREAVVARLRASARSGEATRRTRKGG